MRKNVQKVVRAFQFGRAEKGDHKETISTDGKTIFSYRMAIAERLDNGKVRVVPYEKGPSQTTRQQISAVRWLLRDELEDTNVANVPR